jgi:hypothetical protein
MFSKACSEKACSEKACSVERFVHQEIEAEADNNCRVG